MLKYRATWEAIPLPRGASAPALETLDDGLIGFVTVNCGPL